MQLRETKQDWKASKIDRKRGKWRRQIGKPQYLFAITAEVTKLVYWHRRWAVRAGWGREDTLSSGQGCPALPGEGTRQRDPGSTKAQMFFQPKQSALNFNEHFAHRQLSLPRHLSHSSYSINSPSLFSFKENKWCFQPSAFHRLWVISAKHWCWLCLWRYSLAVQMCYLNYNAGNTFVSVAFHLLHQALKLWGEESPVFSWAPLYFPLFTSQFVTSEELTHASPSSSFSLQLCVCYR